MRSPSGWHQSGIRGREPVETRAASNSISSVPATPSTTTVLGPLKRAAPWMMRTPWLWSSVVTLRWRCDLMPSMRDFSASIAISGSDCSRPIPPMRREKLIAPPVAIIVLLGMQSQRWAAPPITSRSITVTLAPKRAAYVAACWPAGPPPMMTNLMLTACRLMIRKRHPLHAGGQDLVAHRGLCAIEFVGGDDLVGAVLRWIRD